MRSERGLRFFFSLRSASEKEQRLRHPAFPFYFADFAVRQLGAVKSFDPFIIVDEYTDVRTVLSSDYLKTIKLVRTASQHGRPGIISICNSA
jgi:hypothetical protein